MLTYRPPVSVAALLIDIELTVVIHHVNSQQAAQELGRIAAARVPAALKPVV